MTTLIIHPQDPSTSFLSPIYESIQDKKVITGGVNKFQLRQLIKNHDRIIMLGHGTPYGLLAVGEFPIIGSYIIDYSYCDLLSVGNENIYIWCYANHFVKQHGLFGFSSDMFVSELGEATSLGLYDANINQINKSNESFASIVSRNIYQPLHVLYENVIQDYSILAKTNPIAKFNLERLYINSKH